MKPATNLGRTGVCLACRKFFLEGETDTCDNVLLWFPVPTGKAAACEPPVLKKAKAAPPAADSAAADQQPLFAPTSSTMFFPREPDVTPTPDAGPPSKPLPSAATLEAAGAALPVPLPANTGAPQPAAEATAAPPVAADAEAAVAPLPGTPGSTTTESSPGPTALPAAPSSVPSATLPDLSKASPDEIAAVLKLLSSKMQNLSAAAVNEAGPGAPEVPPVLAAPALAPAPAAAPPAVTAPAPAAAPATPPATLQPATFEPGQMDKINSSTHAAAYKKYKAFCERNELAVQVRGAWQSEPQPLTNYRPTFDLHSSSSQAGRRCQNGNVCQVCSSWLSLIDIGL